MLFFVFNFNFVNRRPYPLLPAEPKGLSNDSLNMPFRFFHSNSFNAAPGTGAAMRSAAARLSMMTIEERKELKKEIRECLGPIGLNLKTLHKMKKLDNLVCEVCYPHS